MNTSKNRMEIIAALNFAIAVRGQFSQELAALLDPANIQARLTRHTTFVRKEITNAGGIFDVIDENTKKVDGVSSISKTELPKNMAVIFDKIAVGFGQGSETPGEEGIINYGSINVPAELRNASLVITQGGREVLELPVADMVKGEQSNSPADYFHDLQGFHYLVDDEPMQWRLRFPSGASIKAGGAGNNLLKYLEVRVQGFKTSRKA